MTQDVVTCTPDESLIDVVKTIASKRFSCLVVVEDDIPVGIITERDLVEVLADTLHGVTWEQLSIKHFMTSPIIMISEDLTLNEAILITRSHKIRHVPVVNSEGKLTGILTQTNIVEGFYNSASGL
jgi:CBS domain-containing protein